MQECRGCGETRPVRWWQTWDRDGATSEARYCDTCGAIAASGGADQVSYAEPLEDYAPEGAPIASRLSGSSQRARASRARHVARWPR